MIRALRAVAMGAALSLSCALPVRAAAAPPGTTARPAAAAPADAAPPVDHETPLNAGPSLWVGAGQLVGTALTVADLGFVTYDVIELARGAHPAHGALVAQTALFGAQALAGLGIAASLVKRGDGAQTWAPALGLALAAGLCAGYAAARLPQRPALQFAARF